MRPRSIATLSTFQNDNPTFKTMERYLPTLRERSERFVRHNTSLLLQDNFQMSLQDARMELEQYFFEKFVEMCEAMSAR